MKFPGISIVIEENVMLFSGKRKSYMVKPNPHAYGIKSCVIVFLNRGFVERKVDTYLLMSNTIICVVYVDDCLFCACLQYDIDNLIKSIK